MLAALLTALFASLRRAALQIEILALLHYLGVHLQRSVKWLKLTASDRFLWAWVSSTWQDWRSSLILVQPEAVIGWHRKGFQLYRNLRCRHGRRGRFGVATETRQLTRRMRRENPLWGAPRRHGELLKLGIDIGETSVRKYYPTSFSFCATIADHTLLEYRMCDWIANTIALQMSHSGDQIYSYLNLPCRVDVNARLGYEEARVD
jgi:hypothetical protein